MQIPAKYKQIIFLVLGLIGLCCVLLAVFIGLDQYKKNLPSETTEIATVPVPFETITVEDWESFSNNQPVTVQPGIDGIVVETYKITKGPNGEILGKDKINEEITQETQKRIIKQGMLDPEDTFKKIRDRASQYMDLFVKEDLESIYPMLTASEKKLYAEAQLSSIIKTVTFDVSSYSFVGSMSFTDEKNLNGVDLAKDDLTPIEQPTGIDAVPISPRLIAKLPVEFVYTSIVTGSQKMQAVIYLLHEDRERWGLYYLGPTKHASIKKTKTGDDGGKTLNYPLSFEITLNDLLVFANLNVSYLSYELKNTTVPSVELEKALQLKVAEYTRLTQTAATTPTSVTVHINLRPDLEVSKAVMRDEPGTNYSLVDRNIYDKAWVTLPPGSTGKAWLKFSPAPSRKISTIIVDIQTAIAGLYINDFTFGTLYIN